MGLQMFQRGVKSLFYASNNDSSCAKFGFYREPYARA